MSVNNPLNHTQECCSSHLCEVECLVQPERAGIRLPLETWLHPLADIDYMLKVHNLPKFGLCFIVTAPRLSSN